MSNADQALKLLQRYGTVKYDTLGKRVKNPPDVIYKLRRKGYQIQSVWTTTRSGKRHVCAYSYHSKVAA